MSRPPVIRYAREPRRLGCGCTVPPGSAMLTKGRRWLCSVHQPWVRVRTIAEILAEALAASDAEDKAATP